jgi:hypothetical protein
VSEVGKSWAEHVTWGLVQLQQACMQVWHKSLQTNCHASAFTLNNEQRSSNKEFPLHGLLVQQTLCC